MRSDIDFDTWNEQKKVLNKNTPVLFFHDREIWWCKLGLNIGFEQDGKHKNHERPILILKTYTTNACLGIPLTSRAKIGRYYFDIGMVSGRRATAILSQLRFIDKRRLVNKIDVLQTETFEKLQKAIIQANFI